jgi:outer membrane protein assembly factor BamB
MRAAILLSTLSLAAAACGSPTPTATPPVGGVSNPPGTSQQPSSGAPASSGVAGAAAVDWPMYLGNLGRSAGSTEAILSAANVSRLTPLFTVKLGGEIASSAAIVAGVAYVGAWDGYEYAIDVATGTVRWKTFLGITTSNACQPSVLGVSSGAAVVGGTVYVGGGDNYWYALEASSGAVLWRVFTGDTSKSYYNWSSPLISNGSAYVGIASNCTIPNIRGQVLRVDLASHKIAATLNIVPKGTTGGGVWQSPSLDVTTNTLFVTNGNKTMPAKKQPLAMAILALNAITLAVKSHWQVDPKEAIEDGDWATAPLLYTDAAGRQMVAAANKNGIVYAFLRSNLAAGPVWSQRIAIGGDCAICDEATNSSLAFGDGRIYSAGGKTTVAGVSRIGSIRALDPATGAIIWEIGVDHAVVPSSAYDNGFVMSGVGPQLLVLDAASGAILYSQTTGPETYASPSESGGKIFIGSLNGSFWIFGLPGS